VKETNKEPIRFAVIAADTVVFTYNDGKLLVRLTKVDRPPFFVDTKGLPGGLINPSETAEDASRRHVENKAGIAASKLYIEQLYTFSRVDRDPRGRVVAVAYIALVPWEKLSKEEQSNSDMAWWAPVASAKKLAYDHNEVLSCAVKRLRSRITYTTVLAKLLPREFTLTEFENMYGSILGTNLDKRNFRKKVLKLDIVFPVRGKFTGGRFRPAQLYRFISTEVKEIEVI
jgi:8-oxo-dGTP diphosphatase